jgi:hypothetical protein
MNELRTRRDKARTQLGVNLTIVYLIIYLIIDLFTNLFIYLIIYLIIYLSTDELCRSRNTKLGIDGIGEKEKIRDRKLNFLIISLVYFLLLIIKTKKII